MTILSSPHDPRTPSDASPQPGNVRVRPPQQAASAAQGMTWGGTGAASNVRVGTGAPHAVRILAEGRPAEAPSPAPAPPKPEKRPRCRVAVTGTRVFVTLFVMAVAIPLAYLGGILAGERSLPKEPTPAEIAAAAKSVDDAAAAEEAKEEDGGETILQPHELTFSRSLKGGPGEGVAERQKPRKPFRPAVAPDAQEGGQEAGGPPPMAPGMSPARPSGPPEPPAVPSDLYDFVFQVATYRSEKAASDMRAELEGLGYRTRAERQGANVVVFVDVRGSLGRGEEVRADMARRYGEPLERARKPVVRPIGER